MCDCDVFRREIGRESWKRVVANFSKDGLVCRNTTGLEWGGGGGAVMLSESLVTGTEEERVT